MSDPIDVPVTLWKKTLSVGEVYGHRPGPEVLNLLSTVEAREGPIALSAWPWYLWPWLVRVTDEYARGLSDALTRAIFELRDPQFDMHRRINDAGDATLTRGAVSDEEIEGLTAIRDWCEGGGFSVTISLSFDRALLRR